jgi:phosphomevalonate kinase
VVAGVGCAAQSGKDFVCEKLLERLGGAAEIGRLSAPLKQAFAEENGLDFKELLTDGPYKEKYRCAPRVRPMPQTAPTRRWML